MARSYILFFSHSLTYKDALKTQKKFLDDADHFSYYERTLEPNDPIHESEDEDELDAAIEDKVQGADAVVILAGVFQEYEKWLRKEIEHAQKHKKPIIVIEPWDEERTHVLVKNSASAIIDWDKTLLIEAIEELVK
ncbi:MAG: TIR domain-containing protein [Thiovulaceae bacterium]|nr:TIR domain-containing protein [Sulfurimonadaceae bacterium]